jgi:Na+-transporting NADH:ubiquinone oxidoreductase subunit NqrB
MVIISGSEDKVIATVPALLAALRRTGQHQRVFQCRKLYLTSFTGQKVTTDVVRDALDAGLIVEATPPASLASWTLRPRGRPRKL